MYSAKVGQAIKDTTNPLTLQNLKIMQIQPTFVWLDTIQAVQTQLGGVLQDASSSSQLVQLVIYDLPLRDCSAGASNGEIGCQMASNGTVISQTGDCTSGLQYYQSKYIDPIVALCKAHP